MKWNVQLTWPTLIHILILSLFYWHISNLSGPGKGGENFIYILIFPAYFLIYLPILTSLTYKNRKDWFDIKKRASTILLLFISIPFPLFFMG